MQFVRVVEHRLKLHTHWAPPERAGIVEIEEDVSARVQQSHDSLRSFVVLLARGMSSPYHMSDLARFEKPGRTQQRIVLVSLTR